MNDFTKEELIIMYYNFAETEFQGTNNKLNNIRQKIKSMIDNYCEHEWRCYDDQHNTRRCIECGEWQDGEIVSE